MRACGGGRTGEARQPATGGSSNLSASARETAFGLGAYRGESASQDSGNAKKPAKSESRHGFTPTVSAGVARGATRRAIVAGRVPEHAPIESSSPQGPVISPTPSRGPRRARHSASAGLSGVTVRLPSPWRSEDATPLDELPPPAPPAPPPPPPAPRGPELPPLDIVFRRFTRRKPPPPPRGYACPVSDCHHGKILSFVAKRGAGKTKARTTRERGDYKRARRLGAHTKSRKLPLSFAQVSSQHEYRRRRATSSTRVDAPRSTPRLPPFGRHGAPQRPGPRRGSPPLRRAGAALFRGRDRDARPPGARGCASPLPQPGGERAVRPVAPGVLAGQPRALRRRGRVDRPQRHARRRRRRRGPVLGVARRRAQGRPRAGAPGGVQQRTGTMRHRRRGVRRADPALLSDVDRLCARARSRSRSDGSHARAGPA